VKRKHQENLSRLHHGQKLNAGFGIQSVNSLGPLSSQKHHDTVSSIKNGKYSSSPQGTGIAATLGPIHYYTITDEERCEKMENLLKRLFTVLELKTGYHKYTYSS
jgi:hypothetical protein